METTAANINRAFNERVNKDTEELWELSSLEGQEIFLSFGMCVGNSRASVASRVLQLNGVLLFYIHIENYRQPLSSFQLTHHCRVR